MNILTINCGSSSQGFKIYQISESKPYEIIASGKAKNVATKTQADAYIEWQFQTENGKTVTTCSSHRIAAIKILELIHEKQISIDAIGHRFVHGGDDFQKTTQIDAQVMKTLSADFHFAPVHNPNSYSVIEVCQNLLPGIPQFAVFDTAFHTSMPDYAREYAIPVEIAHQFSFRKYGFHGLSYQYVSAKTAELLNSSVDELKLILCHLGTGGSSVVAVNRGKVLDTSMGYTPLPGLVMSTRCGDIDAEIVLQLIRQGYNADEVSDILNKKSGLIGLSGFSSNLEEIIKESENGNTACQLAYEVYTHRLKSYLGAYTWLLNGADAIVFTDDVGVTSWKLREKVCSDIDNLGILVSVEANKHAGKNLPALISLPSSKTQLWVIPTDEELVIMQEVFAFMQA
jgi:acetate kinase